MPLTISIRAAGIPCKAKVLRYRKHPGSFSRFAADPEQYFGWTDLRYKILDRKGYDATWLRNKLEDEGLIDQFEYDLQHELEEYYEALREDAMEARLAKKGKELPG